MAYDPLGKEKKETHFQMQDESNKEKMQKGQRGVWIEPKVKALYAKGGG